MNYSIAKYHTGHGHDGSSIGRPPAATARRIFKFSKGGVAPIDYENLEVGISGLVNDLEAAMASLSLQISFLDGTSIVVQPDCTSPVIQQPKDKLIPKQKPRKPSPLARVQPLKQLSTIQSNEGSMKVVGNRVAKAVLNDKKMEPTKRKPS